MSSRRTGGGEWLLAHRIAELQRQIARDTIWCMPCGINARSNRADVIYTVSDEARSVRVPACRKCFRRESQVVEMSASEPVTQPTWIALADALIALLAASPAPSPSEPLSPKEAQDRDVATFRAPGREAGR